MKGIEFVMEYSEAKTTGGAGAGTPPGAASAPARGPALRLSLRSLFLLAMVALVHLVAAVYTVIVFETRKTDAIHDADELMLAGATFAQERLGTNYHDRITDAHSVSRQEFDEIVARNDQLCQKLGLQYIWSLLELDGRYVFTSATHSVLTNQHSDCAKFLAAHTNPGAYTNAFASMQREIATFSDKWGEGRMVLLPGWDAQHRKYLFAASIQMADFKALLRRTLVESILVGLLIAGLFCLLAWLLSRMITQPLTRLTVELERMGKGELTGEIQRGSIREVAALADAFAAMRTSVREKVEALRESEERYRGLVDSIGMGVTLISPQMEILAFNRQNRAWFPEVKLHERPLCYRVFNKPASDKVCDYCPVVKTLQDGEPHEAITATPRDGLIINYRIRSTPLKDAAGRISAVIETVEDITARQRIEDALKRSEANLSAIADSTDDLIFLLDAQSGRLLQFNSAFAREIARSYRVAVHIGMSGRDVLPAERLPVWDALLQQVQQQGALATDYLRPSDHKHFEVNFSTVKTGQQVTGVAVFIRDITARRRAEDALRDSEAKLRVLFNILPVGISIVDQAYNIVSQNPALGRILGMSEEEIRSGRYRQRRFLRGDGTPLPADEIPSVRALRENCEVHNAEVGVVREDGVTVWVAVSAAPLPGVGVAVVTRDITLRKRAQEALRASRAQLAAVLESTQDLIWSVDAHSFAVLEFNSAFAHFIKKTFGVTLRPLMTAREILPDDRYAFWERLLKGALDAGSGSAEYQVPGTAQCLEVLFNPIRTEGRVTALAIFARDITARKQAEERLRESEALLRSFFDSPGIYRAIVELEAGEVRYISANQTVADTLGFSVAELQGMTSTQLGAPSKNVEQFIARCEESRREQRPVTFEYERAFAAGGRTFIHTVNFLATGPTGLPRFAYTSLDITARKQAEAALATSENQLRAFLENSALIGWLKDSDGRHVFVSENFLRHFQMRREDWIGKTDFEVWPRAVAEELQRNDRAVLEGGATREVMEQVPGPDGQPSWWLSSKFLFHDATGKRFVGGVGVNITERVQAEAALRGSEAQLTGVLESTQDLIWSVDPGSLEILSFNSAFAQEINATYGFNMGPGTTLRDFLPTEKIPVWEQLLQRALREGRYTDEFFRADHPKHFERTFNPIVKSGQPDRVAIFARDITARKRAEAALQESQAQLAAIFGSTDDLIWSMDAYTLEVRSFNAAFAQEVRQTYGVELRPGMNLRAGVPAEMIPVWEQLLQRALKEGRYTDEYLRQDKRYFERTFNPLLNSSNVAIFIREITARKRAEAALRESEANFRAFFESVTDLIVVGTPEGRILFTNSAVSQTLGYAPAAIQNMHILDLHPADKRHEAEQIFAAMFRGERSTCPLPLARKDGGLVPVETRVWFGRWNGEPCIFGLCKNLTAEQEAQQRFERLFRHNPALMALSSLPDRKVTDVNDVFLATLGFTRDEIIGRTTAELGLFSHPEQQAAVADKLRLNGRLANFELQVRRKDGVVLDGLFSGEVITSQGQQYFLTVMTDITARKRAELALRESEEKFTRLAAHISDVLYSVDADLREFRYLSPSFERMFGYTPEDILLAGGRRAFLASVIQGGQFALQDDGLNSLEQEHSHASFSTESWWRCKDGTLRCVRDHWMPVFEAGRLVSTEGILTDVTKERLAQDQLKERESQLKEAQRLASLGNWSWTVATGELVWSEEIFRIFGRDPHLPPPHIFEHAQLFPPENWQQVEAVFRHAAQTGESYILDTAFVRQDGQRGHLLAHGASIRDEQGRVVKIFGTIQDITDRRRLEQQLLEISEREQRRIGQDLHDGVGQQLAAMRFQSSTLLQKMASRKKVSLAEVERLDTLLEETLKQVRNLSRGLHPVSLDSQGLMHGLRELARQCQNLFGVACTFECADTVQLHDQRAALNLYRIAQEAMRNAAVHGAPRHIRIELTANGDAVSLAIADDGRGLPANIKETTGLGLEIMRYRAASIGSSCDIQSQPGVGVTIRCVWRPST